MVPRPPLGAQPVMEPSRSPTADSAPRRPSAPQLPRHPGDSPAPEAGSTPSATAAPRDRLAVLATDAPVPAPPPAVASRTARQFSVQDILDGRVLQRQVRVHPLELGVFSLELPQLSHIRHRRAPVLAPPLEECRLADAVRPSQVRHGHAALGIPQDANDLGLTEPRLPHDRSLDQSSLRSTVNRSGKLTRASSFVPRYRSSGSTGTGS